MQKWAVLIGKWDFSGKKLISTFTEKEYSYKLIFEIFLYRINAL